jgi:MFS family permease
VSATDRKHRVKKSLKLSVLDGSAFAAMVGLTQNYVTPFALALKATTAQIGLLTSIPNLTMALSQLAAPDLSARAGSRKAFILPVVFLHALMWLPIALLPFVFHGAEVWWLIGFVTLSTVAGAIANPAWGSMMADLVPMRLRGRYFAARGRIMGIVTLVLSLIGGGILELFKGNAFVGFAILFSGAAFFRLFSLYFLSGQYEPTALEEKQPGPGLFQIFRRVGSSNLGKYTLYIALINLAANISSPFFPVYMLSELKFSYTAYVINVSFFALAVMLFQTYWGRRADWAGNIKVIAVTSFLVPIVPLMWLVSTNQYYLIAVQIFSGFAWGGFNLASVNFVYDVSEKENRTKYIAVYNSITGLGICLGALLGGYIVPYLPRVLGSQLLSLFTLSGLLRGIIVIFLLRLVFEVRRVPKVNVIDFLIGRGK